VLLAISHRIRKMERQLHSLKHNLNRNQQHLRHNRSYRVCRSSYGYGR
jgi:hypothetical protein